MDAGTAALIGSLALASFANGVQLILVTVLATRILRDKRLLAELDGAVVNAYKIGFSDGEDNGALIMVVNEEGEA